MFVARRHTVLALLTSLVAACSSQPTTPGGAGPIFFPGMLDTVQGPGGDAIGSNDAGGLPRDSDQPPQDGSSLDGTSPVDGTAPADGTAADTQTGGPDAILHDSGAGEPDGAATDDVGDGLTADTSTPVGDGAGLEEVGGDGAGNVDAGNVDAGNVDAGNVDAGNVDDGMVSEQDSGWKDTGSGGDPFGADVPWGSEEDAAPYDAGPPDYPDAGAGGVPANICTPKIAELNLKEEKVGGKVDIVWWIDTSGSMSQEAKYLNSNINAFAQFIAAAKVDFRMILVGNGFGICVQPPLGGPGCSNGPQFQHVKTTIGSTNGHSVLMSSYTQWKGFLRTDATKNFVAVTDDNSSTAAQWFIDQLQVKDPVQFPKTPLVPYGFVYHSIVGYETKSDCPTIAKKGAVYLDLTAKTGGAKFKICETNWAPIFQALAKSVAQTAKPGCDYPIPYPSGVKPNPYLGLSYVAKDDLFDVPKAPGNTCPSNGVGFVVDKTAAPTSITLCPASCDLLKGGGNIQFDFGCF